MFCLKLTTLTLFVTATGPTFQQISDQMFGFFIILQTFASFCKFRRCFGCVWWNFILNQWFRDMFAENSKTHLHVDLQTSMKKSHKISTIWQRDFVCKLLCWRPLPPGLVSTCITERSIGKSEPLVVRSLELHQGGHQSSLAAQVGLQQLKNLRDWT